MNRWTQITAAVALAASTSTAFAANAGGPLVESHVQSFLEALAKGGGKPLEALSPADARQVLLGAQKGAKLPPADVSEKTIDYNGRPLKLTIVRPQGAKGALPGFMFFHGGGWVLGSYADHERFVRDLVVDSGQEAIFVNFTPSPEAHYPTSINQEYLATQYADTHRKAFSLDNNPLAVVGNSVGGNAAAVVALKAKLENGPKLRSQILFWPVTNASFENTSYDTYANGYFLSKSAMKWFWDAYTTDTQQRAEIYASPLLATPEQLKGLPPALVQTAENDVLRDEGEAYARHLDQAGVPVVSVRYNGMIHDYGLLNALADVPAVRAALHQASEELKQSLER
ncbi:alpha/beta hydrolase [Pseudomonas typographi]|uniref:Alpha/beta hydrolase n=1 Tax=Pseudomonas typographi TaxID=2715964 RepID=A0ABR7Z6L5_9PSED|nr:alpha/beta hydrolase [Pseudomonas typographi]MBD1601037.1 alpha/beta hydrolase [Pseudomonas typographi]